MPIIDGAGRFTPPGPHETSHFVEHVRTQHLSVGTYSLPAGGIDDQTPHREDEIYVVMGGRATFVDDHGATAVSAGDTVLVPAGVEHRFVDITEELRLLVLFAPPYRSST
jgi:mannose-6-phosphate isomerase-like protein (cupin superfamily)